jgi:hypothetical protein
MVRSSRSGPDPDDRRTPAFGGQHGHQIAAGGGAEQPRAAGEVRLARPVGAADEGEVPQWQDHLLERAVATHRDALKRSPDGVGVSADPPRF